MKVIARYLAVVDIPMEVDDRFAVCTEEDCDLAGDLVNEVFQQEIHTDINVTATITNASLDSLLCVSDENDNTLVEL